MKKGKPSPGTPITDILSGLLKKLQAEGRPSVEEASEIWKRLAGEEAAKYSRPRRLNRQRLVVEVENSGWMHELRMRKAQLQEGLIELLGAGRVKELSFRIGEKKDHA